MIAIIVAETILLALLCVLVAGLMRSHAEILKWMSSSERPEEQQRDQLPVLPPDRDNDAPAPRISGKRLDNSTVDLGFRREHGGTLLAFLSSGCATCQNIWEGMRAGVSDDLPDEVGLVVVTKDRNYESPTKLSKLAPGDAALVMSSAAWQDYEVPRYPYFIYVDGATATIHGEGTAETWAQVVSLLTDFMADLNQANAERTEVPRYGSRIEREDAELAAAGIHPGHPSLYAPIFAETDESSDSATKA